MASSFFASADVDGDRNLDLVLIAVLTHLVAALKLSEPSPIPLRSFVDNPAS